MMKLFHRHLMVIPDKFCKILVVNNFIFTLIIRPSNSIFKKLNPPSFLNIYQSISTKLSGFRCFRNQIDVLNWICLNTPMFLSHRKSTGVVCKCDSVQSQPPLTCNKSADSVQTRKRNVYSAAAYYCNC